MHPRTPEQISSAYATENEVNSERTEKKGDEYLLLHSEEERRLLLNGVDELIEKVYGSKLDQNNIQKGLQIKPKYDTLVFLDVSARPLRTLFTERLKHSMGSSYSTLIKPEIRFINFDSGFYRKYTNRETYNFQNLTFKPEFDTLVDKIKGVKSADTQERESHSEKQRMLIVDEVANEGSTIKSAKRMVETYFNHTVGNVDTHVFMRPFRKYGPIWRRLRLKGIDVIGVDEGRDDSLVAQRIEVNRDRVKKLLRYWGIDLEKASMARSGSKGLQEEFEALNNLKEAGVVGALNEHPRALISQLRSELIKLAHEPRA